jgi:hypothetical protein
VRPEDLFALPLAVYRLQLSAAATAVAWWYVVVRALWLPREARPGPSLAELVQETRRDTFESDEGGTA